MRRLIEVIDSGRVDLAALVTHHARLVEIVEAYDLLVAQRDDVLKVVIEP